MENKEPNRDDAAEQKARDVEYKEKTEQLLEFHGQEKVLTRDPTMLLGALGAYLIFVGTLVAVGGLAASNNHKTTSEIFLLASALLILIVPVGVIWYFLRVRTPEKPTNKDEGRKSLADRIAQSPIGRFLTRFTNNPVVRVFNLLLCIYWIIDSILKFPLKPRSSLAFIALNTALFSALVTLEIARSFDMAVQAQFKEIWEFNNVVRDGLLMLVKHQDRFIDTQLGTNEKNLAAIVELNRFVRVVANIKEPDQLEGPKAEEHKETEPPNNQNPDTCEEK